MYEMSSYSSDASIDEVMVFSNLYNKKKSFLIKAAAGKRLPITSLHLTHGSKSDTSVTTLDMHKLVPMKGCLYGEFMQNDQKAVFFNWNANEGKSQYSNNMSIAMNYVNTATVDTTIFPGIVMTLNNVSATEVKVKLFDGINKLEQLDGTGANFSYEMLLKKYEGDEDGNPTQGMSIHANTALANGYVTFTGYSVPDGKFTYDGEANSTVLSFAEGYWNLIVNIKKGTDIVSSETFYFNQNNTAAPDNLYIPDMYKQFMIPQSNLSGNKFRYNAAEITFDKSIETQFLAYNNSTDKIDYEGNFYFPTTNVFSNFTGTLDDTTYKSTTIGIAANLDTISYLNVYGICNDAKVDTTYDTANNGVTSNFNNTLAEYYGLNTFTKFVNGDSDIVTTRNEILDIINKTPEFSDVSDLIIDLKEIFSNTILPPNYQTILDLQDKLKANLFTNVNNNKEKLSKLYNILNNKS